MDQMNNLAGMFSSIAELLQERDAVLMERIRQLETRVGELEEKLRVFELHAQDVPAAVVEVEEIADGEPVESEDPVLVEKHLEIADDMEQADDTGDYGAEVDLPADPDEVMIGEKIVEQPEIEIEFEFEEENQQELVVDKARPDWYDWEVDIPGPYIEDIRDGIGLNDRILFLNVLFDGDEDGFALALSALNGMSRLVDAVEYIRERYPQWDEESDEVYRFYMIVRRRFNKQIQES